MKNVLFLLGFGSMTLFTGPLHAASSTAQSTTPSAAKQSNVLTSQELQFSNQLSSYHREVFITVFTPQMRQETITMIEDHEGEMDDEMPMSADMCVEQTLMNHRNPPTAPTTSS